MGENKGRLQSEYNEAAMQMQRLHNLWLKCESYKEKGLIEKYKNSLRTAESELKYDAGLLSNHLDEEDPESYLVKLKESNKQILDCEKLFSKVVSGNYIRAIINKKWGLLIQKEELLREIQEESGKGGKRSNPDDYDEID